MPDQDPLSRPRPREAVCLDGGHWGAPLQYRISQLLPAKQASKPGVSPGSSTNRSVDVLFTRRGASLDKGGGSDGAQSQVSSLKDFAAPL